MDDPRRVIAMTLGEGGQVESLCPASLSLHRLPIQTSWLWKAVVKCNTHSLCLLHREHVPGTHTYLLQSVHMAGAVDS